MDKNKTWDIAWNYIEQVIDTVHELFLILDENLKVAGANDQFYKFFQVPEEETEGKLIYELGNGQWDIKKLKILLDAILAEDTKDASSHRIYGGHFEKFIVDYNFPKIGRKTLVLNAKKIYKSDGKTPMILVSIQDATTQKELEEILMSVGDGLIVVDKDAKIVMVNKAFENLLGWKTDEVLGKKMTEVVPVENEDGKAVMPEERRITQALLGKALTKQKNWYFVRKDKKRFPVSSVVTPIIISNEITGAVEVFRDITVEHELDKAKTEFVSIASHQLRTPLSTINWYTEMLTSGDVGKVTKKQKGYLDEIAKGNKRMVMLVNSLLNVSRLELGTFMIQPEDVDLVELSESALSDLKMQIKKSNIILEKNYDQNLKKIKADPKLTRIIFDNLLSNAIKYVMPGGKVSITISIQDPDVITTVYNDGPGIPKDAQHRIFTKMFRDDLARQRDPDGNGLGLYIVKSILDNSGGKIWFESDPNSGTHFHVSIPLAGMKAKEGTKSVE